MPELSNQMYCSEQICIPPPFPYLLRQYAKAAIRTQPNDLLKWSTAYFRCLSLNIPPPVKQRLEYPIPQDYYGLTPGWLKALLYQLQINQTVHFKVLWDRWTGACLQHDTLIKILCLGGFDNPQAIPWLRFVGICAAHLTDNLTNSMNLICEILTEEPEGGSASIPLETFMDLYNYLAQIDASKPQTLLNLYFTDSLLNLWKERKDLEEEVEETKGTSVKEEESLASAVTEKISEEEILSKISKEDISCPSLVADDNYSVDYSTKNESESEEIDGTQPNVDLADILDMHYAEGEAMEEESDVPGISLHDDKDSDESTDDQVSKSNHDDDDLADKPEDEIIQEVEPEPGYTAERISETDDVSLEGIGNANISEGTDTDKVDENEADQVINVTNLDVIESVDTIQEVPPTIEARFADDDEILQEDLENFKVYQQEIAGETDEEIEKYKCKLIEEMPLTGSQIDAIEAFKIPAPIEKAESVVELKEEEKEEESPNEVVYVNAIPGIGPIVPDDLIQAVNKYMKDVAKIQHGMVMPRNIRHYNCPPLEITEC